MLIILILVSLWFLLIRPVTLGAAIYHEVFLIQRAGIIPAEGINYRLDQDLVVVIDDKKISIPAGFKTDLASIPRILWPFFAPNDSVLVYPAVVHDYLYTCGDWVTRKFADDVLHSFLLLEGASRGDADSFYIAVRLFGAPHFSEKNKECDYSIIEFEYN